MGRQALASSTLRDSGVLVPLGTSPSPGSDIPPIPLGDPGLPHFSLGNPTGPFLSFGGTGMVSSLSSQNSAGVHWLCLPSTGPRLVPQECHLVPTMRNRKQPELRVSELWHFNFFKVWDVQALGGLSSGARPRGQRKKDNFSLSQASVRSSVVRISNTCAERGFSFIICSRTETVRAPAPPSFRPRNPAPSSLRPRVLTPQWGTSRGGAPHPPSALRSQTLLPHTQEHQPQTQTFVSSAVCTSLFLLPAYIICCSGLQPV